MKINITPAGDGDTRPANEFVLFPNVESLPVFPLSAIRARRERRRDGGAVCVCVCARRGERPTQINSPTAGCREEGGTTLRADVAKRMHT